MWENAYSSIKNPKASPATDSSLPLRNSAPLYWQLSASETGAPLDQILDQHLPFMKDFHNTLIYIHKEISCCGMTYLRLYMCNVGVNITPDTM